MGILSHSEEYASFVLVDLPDAGKYNQDYCDD